MSQLCVVYVDGNSGLRSIPACLAGVRSLGVKGCNVSFGDRVRVGGCEGAKNEECVVILRAPCVPVPPLMELAAKTLHSHLAGQLRISKCIAILIFFQFYRDIPTVAVATATAPALPASLALTLAGPCRPLSRPQLQSTCLLPPLLQLSSIWALLPETVCEFASVR